MLHALTRIKHATLMFKEQHAKLAAEFKRDLDAIVAEFQQVSADRVAELKAAVECPKVEPSIINIDKAIQEALASRDAAEAELKKVVKRL